MSDSVNKVSLQRIIGNFIGNLGIKNVDNIEDDLARWACEAENKIGSTSSYRRFECELNIRNRKAALPPNFVYLNAIKYGNKIVPTTKRSFRMFNKGSVGNVSNNTEKREFVSGNKQTNVPGVPLVVRVDLSGSFIAGDIVTVTITTNNCGNVSSNTFTYLVQVGDSLNDIAIAIDSQINAIQNLGYTSAISNNAFVITASSPDVILNISLFTDSINGSLVQTIVQKRVPTKINTPTLSNSNTNPILTSKNLADSTVAKLNVGINAQGVSGQARGYSYDYDVSPTEQVFSIDNGCINFNAYDNEKIGISYMGIDLDEDGWPLISEIHEDAVTHYLMYMYKSIDYWRGKMNRGTWLDLQNRWFDLCGQARGDDELPNSEEIKYLSNLWMQLIPLPTKEYF
jgi:hypothetical protein